MDFMKKLLIFVTIVLNLIGCKSRIGKIDVINTDTSRILVCDYEDIKETRDIKFSELMDSIRIIKFEDTPDAYFKCQGMHFSDNYIAILQRDNRPVLLFDKTGKFITEVGAFGGGPGEYSTSIIDCILDEKNDVIYLLPFSGPRILKYDFKGKYIGEIKFPVSINKGKISLQADSTLSVFHLAFKDLNEQKFNGASVNLNNDNISYFYIEDLATDIKGQGGGFNHEVWSYRSADGFPLSMTYNNTLYHFNPKENIVEAAFVFNINKEAHKDDLRFYILTEIPDYYLVYMVGDAKDVMVDKKNNIAFNVNLINDYLGDVASGLIVQDGYYWNYFDPTEFAELLEESLKSDSLSETQRKYFESLLTGLNEDDNDILLLGKLKQ